MNYLCKNGHLVKDKYLVNRECRRCRENEKRRRERLQKDAQPSPPSGISFKQVEKTMDLLRDVIVHSHRMEMTAVVDDDFPQVKYEFDRAVLAYADHIRPKQP